MECFIWDAIHSRHSVCTLASQCVYWLAFNSEADLLTLGCLGFLFGLQGKVDSDAGPPRGARRGLRSPGKSAEGLRGPVGR